MGFVVILKIYYDGSVMINPYENKLPATLRQPSLQLCNLTVIKFFGLM